MAERAFETPHHFSDYVVTPNIQSFRTNSKSLQEAFNSVMSVDALAGHLFVFLSELGADASKDDAEFRQNLANENIHFSIIRDAAKTYKHISLTRGQPKIKHASQTSIAGRPYGSGLYGVGSFGGDEVMIELNDGSTKHCLSETIAAHEFLKSKIPQ